MDKVLGTAPPDDPTSSPIKRLEAQMAGGSSREEKVSRSPKEVRATARSIAEEIGEDTDEVLRVIELRGRSLLQRHGLTRAAELIADMFDLDCVSAVARALGNFVDETLVKDEPACAEEEECEGFESDEAPAANDEEEDEGCESSSDHGPELVEYLRSDMVTVVQAHLVDDDLDDGKPPMRLRRLDNGELLRASRHRVLRGAERRGEYEVDGEESVADARGPHRQTGMLGGGGAKSAPSGLRASVARASLGAASSASEQARVSGTVDDASLDDVDLFANWGSVRSDGSHRTRTRSGAFGREVAASDDGSRVSELTDASRPSGRSGSRSMLGSLAVGSGAGGMGRAKVDPGHEASGMPLVAKTSTGEDVSEQFKLATVTFDDGESKKPMKKMLMPAVTTVKDVKEFDEVIFWILRGAGEKEHRPSYFPNILAVQVAEQVFNTVHEAAVSRLEYPFPIQMTPFVVLALCTGSLGAQTFEGGSAQEVKAAGTHVFYYKGRCLLLDDIVLKEDMPDEWADAEILRGPLVWPSGNAMRSRVRVGNHTKAETLVRRIKAFAEVAGMFYNDVFQGQLEVLASDFESLAKQRANSRRIYPLVMLSVAFETLMFKFVVQLRSQAMKLIYHLEHMQKSVVRPHVFQALRMVMKGRDKDFDMAWTWPSHFMDVTAPDSDFMRVYEEFKVDGLLAVTMGGMAAFSVPTTNKKPGTGASGAEVDDGGELAGQEEAADVVAAASAAAQKDADKKITALKAKGGANSTVRNVFGPEYAAGVVQVNAVGVTKDLWLTICLQWLRACRGSAEVGAAFTYYCFAGACFGGCGKKKEECEAEWKALHPKITVRHGPIPMPLFKLVQTSVNVNWALVRVGFARGGGLLQHNKRIEPGDVRSAVVDLMQEYLKQKMANATPDGGSGGASGASARDVRSTTASGGVACEDAVAEAEEPLITAPLGGGSVALWSRGRGGRVAPKTLTDLTFDDIEQDLDAAVNDADERPSAPPSSEHRVPAAGLGEMFKRIFPSDEDVEREETADWLVEATSMAADLAGQGAGVRSFVRSLAVSILLPEVADPRASDLSPDAAWQLVRARTLALAATSTTSAIQSWALSFCDREVEVGAEFVGLGNVVMCPAGPLVPGGTSATQVLEELWPVHDYGEMLAADGDSEPERAKCLYLSIAAAVGMKPGALLAALKSRAREFVRQVPQPKPGELVPEALLYAFELAHDLLERDHPQMRASLLWFGDLVLAHTMIGFCCASGRGGMTVELFKGTSYDASSSACVLGFVECAASHARMLKSPVTPETLGAWQQTVASVTGKAPGRWYMSGFPHIVRTLRGSLGQHRMRDPASLWKCEVCPSLVAPSVRVHMRRFIGAASASGADVSCCGDPLMVMVEGTGLARLVAESRVVLSEISMAREAAAIAAARSVVAGSAPPPAFDSVGFAGGSEGIGRSSVPEMSVEFQSELRSGCIQFSAGNAKSWLACHGWAMSQHEDSGVFDGVKRVLHGCDEAVRGLELLELAATGVRIDSFADAALSSDDDNCVESSKSRDEWGSAAHGTAGPPECSTSSRQVVSNDVSMSKKSSDSAPSAPSTVNTNDHYNDKSNGESDCGKTSLRPDTAAAVPVVVPGRFGRGFGRAPYVTPTAGGIQHDCRTFGCLRQAGSTAAVAAGTVVHCCVECFESNGERHSRECDHLSTPSGAQRPWAPATLPPGVDPEGRRIRHMDESDDPSGMDEVDSLKQVVAPPPGFAPLVTEPISVPVVVPPPSVGDQVQQVLHGADEAVRGLELLEFAATGVQLDSMGASRTISAEIKSAAEEAIAQLDCCKKFSVEAAVSELVDLWVTFPMEPTELETTLRIAQIEFVTNSLMKETGRHEEVIRLYRGEFLRRFGNHLDSSRIDNLPGLTDEVRSVIKSVAERGARVDEVGPRWNLRLNMNSKLAEEHGKVAVEKVVKDGRNGRIVLFSSLVEKQLLDDERRLMVAKVIRVAKRFLSGAIDPADSRWCNAQLDANTLTPAKGIGPGGSVKLPTQLEASKGMLMIAFARPGLLAYYSKHDVSEAFRLVWLAIEMCGLFATSIPRWVLGLGLGNFYCVLLALSFGSTISPGFFDYFSKAISMAHSSFAPPDPARNGVLAFVNFVLVDDIVLMGVREGLSLMWSVMVCQWAMRMALGTFAVNETKGQEEAPWEQKKILWGVGHDATAVHVDPMALRLQMTPVKREKGAGLFFNVLFNWGSFEFGRWQVQVLGGNMVFFGSVCRVMWPLMMRLAQVTYLLPDGPVGVTGTPTQEVREAYEEVWRVVELLRLVGGSAHWWDSTFGGSVASTMPLRERLLFSNAEECLVWVGGDANMNGVAAGSWTDGVYAIIRTEDWGEAIMDVVLNDLGKENVTKDQLLVAIWEFLCFLMIATACAEKWANKVVLYVTDNMLVQRWISLLRARHDSGNFICGLLTLLMARFRFELFSVYINTERNMWDEPSRVFDDDDVRKGPGLDEIDAHMAKVFPGMVEISVSDQLRYYLRPGGLLNAYELYGLPDPVARSLARARSAPTSASLLGMTCIGLYSGIMAFEREVTGLGGCVRAIGEWSAASRAIGRLDLGDVEFFENVLSDDHKSVDPEGVEGALITASCVDYSSAGAQEGLNGTRGWQVVDAPRTLLHFRDLLVSLVENVWGWIDANDGKSFAFYSTAMKRLQHTVWPPQRLNSRHLGMGIQSERAFVFTNRSEFDGALGEPRRLDEVRLPKVPMRRKLLPISEVLRRRSECELAIVPGSFRASRVQAREFGPIRIGDVEFASRKGDGSLRAGAKVKLDGTGQVWRVLYAAADGRLRLRSGKNVVTIRPSVAPVVVPFRIDIYSVEGQAFRVTASDVAEPPLLQSKAAYWESRCVPGFYRILLEGDAWSLMEKPAGQLRLWKQRSAEELSDSLLPKTVPQYSSALAWLVLGNSIASRMAVLGVGELNARWQRAKTLLAAGEVELVFLFRPSEPDDLYDSPALKWRLATIAKETFVVQVPDRHGIDDSHLNVVVKPRRDADRGPESLSVEEGEAALGHLRSFASSGGYGDAVAYGSGDAEQVPVGAEPRRSSRTRSTPDLLRMPATMKGGARLWRESLAEEDAGPTEVSQPEAAAVKRGSGAVKARVVSKKARSAKKAQGVDPVHVDTVVPSWPESSPFPVWTDAYRDDVRAKLSMPELSDAFCDEQLDQAYFSATGIRIVSGGGAAVGAASGRGSGERPIFGPDRPPVRRKARRKRGVALARLEGYDAFRSGDWHNIEKFATVRMPMFSVAFNTLKGYESAWKHWVSFQYYAQLDIFLDCSTKTSKLRASTWLLSFVALLTYACGYKASTIKKCLMAIRFFHLAHEFENPLEKLPRVWQAYRAVKRQEGPTERKHPITPEMCDWLDADQRGGGLKSVIKRASRYVAIFLGCRCSEYLGPEIHWEKIILVSCIIPMLDKAYCSWFDEFNGLMVTFRASKTDQYNEGCKRYIGIADNPRCAVLAFREWRTLQPEHFDHASSRDQPMFTLPDGHVLGRNEVQGDYREAASALGLPTEQIGTHSCRVACATWLYQAGYSIDFIKRHARWVGDSVHVYLWEGSGLHGMVKKMSSVEFTLHTHIF